MVHHTSVQTDIAARFEGMAVDRSKEELGQATGKLYGGGRKRR